MLTREKVEHGLRAAAEILGTTELVLIGSATALMGDGRYTLRMARSDEIDTYSPDPQARGSESLGIIGADSRFFDTHKFYVDGVSPDTARMPADWRERAATSPLRTDPAIRVTVPELGDVALSKMIAWREKDIGWLEDATMLGRSRRRRCPDRGRPGARLRAFQWRPVRAARAGGGKVAAAAGLLPVGGTATVSGRRVRATH